MRVLIRPHSTTSEPLTVAPTSVRITSRPLRVLDFDIENRPLSYLGSDYTTAEITAIAWAWCEAPDDVACYLLGECSPVTMLQAFRAAYDRADMVTGHFIRGHDLPMINGAMLEYGLPPLADKLTQDTKIDKVRTKGQSNSQESWAATWELEHPKVHMNQKLWRDANRLTPDGLAAARTRVVGDVQQHIEFRRWMLSKGYLAAPVMWRCGVSSDAVYTP